MAAPTVEYVTRDMLSVTRQRPLKQNLLSAWFVRGRIPHGTKYIQLDKVNAQNMIARYTNRAGGSNKIGLGTFGSTIHVAPYAYEEVPYTPSDLDDRLPGMTEYEVTPERVAAAFTAGALEELETRLDNLEEQQLAEMLTTGQIAVSGEGVDYVIDYGMDSSHIITLGGGAEWDEPTTNDIPSNLQDWSSLIMDDYGLTPDILLLGRTAGNLFKTDSTILSNLDNRRVDIGMINPRWYPSQRATYLGTYRDVGVDLQVWVYNGKYEYLSGGVKAQAPFLGPTQAIMTSSQLEIEYHFGKIENFKAPNFRAARFPNRFESDDGRNRSITMESSPLPVLRDVESVVSATVA